MQSLSTSSFCAAIAALETRGKSTEITATEAEEIVEELDKVRPTLDNPLARSEDSNSQLMPMAQDNTEKGDCLRALAGVCRRHVILPKSYIMPDIELGEVWKLGGVADIRTGKNGQDDVCIKTFRHQNRHSERKIKGVGRTSFGGNVTLPWIIPGILPSSGAVEERFASKRAPFPGVFNIRHTLPVWLSHPPDVEQHQRLHNGTSRRR